MQQFGLGRGLAAAMVLVAGAGALNAGIHLKARAGRAERIERSKSRSAERAHYIVHFESVPNDDTRKALSKRGLRVVAYLPDTAVIVGVSGEPRFEGLGVTGYESLTAEDKL
ncbi:MAG: hypothetical protein FJW30_28180, partial [Acidobacteria bacterium]|nr:hypothetical protein [Acidobacteriota bacterium]